MPPGRREAASLEWVPPAQVDEYLVLRPLGQGGMGSVYVARDTALGRLVALKFIAGDAPDDVARQRFHNEGRALARLTHPNVVTIHRVGEIDGRPYLVCELVEGDTLARLALPLPASRVIAIGTSAARGLAAVHRHGLLHRDLKPANIALMPDGEAKLLDFGLATVVETGRVPPREAEPGYAEEWSLTAEGRTVGTPFYLAPEIFEGELASRRSDVYALGAVLYELSTGSPPSLNDLARDPASDDAGLSAIIDRCLEDDPDLRYASADEVLHALEQLGQKERGAPIPEGNPYRGLRPFEAEHRALFFGRGPDTRAVLDRLRGEALVLVAGGAGVGKSSLCRAGVVPLVLEGQLDAARAWRAVTLVPGRRPVQALAAALAETIGLSEERFADLVREDPWALGRSLRRRLGAHEGLLIFLDQAEELCTIADAEEAAQVAESLASLGGGPMRLLLTVRGDLFTRVAGLPGLAAAMPAGLHLLGALTPEQLREAVVGPALRAGGRFESETLVDTLVGAAAQAPGGAALLSFALAELWDRRDPARNVITAGALTSIGGVTGALARHADTVLGSLPEEQRRAVPRLLTGLVTADGTRTRKTAAELGQKGETEAGRIALENLVRGRLLVAGDIRGETAYELAHEALIEGWETLRDWLDTSAEARRTRQRLTASAAEWQRLGDKSLLWSARQLLQLEQLDERDLDGLQTAFVAASRRALRRRRVAAVASLLGAALFAAAIYVGLKLAARAELATAVAERREPARRALAEATALAAQAADLRRDSTAIFTDPGRGPLPADAAWTTALTAHGRALELERDAERRLLRASHALEATMLLDPANHGLRELLAEVTFLRLTLAERGFQTQQREDLALRLRTFAGGSPLAAALDAPAQLAVASTPPGARVSLEHYVEREGKLVLEPAQPFGTTPLAARALPPGSYRLTLELDGRARVLYPVLLVRGQRRDLAIDLPPADAVRAGTVLIPAGRFLFGSADDEGLRRFLMAPPQHEVETAAYLIGRTEVTFAEYLEFLRDLPPATRAEHMPRAENAIRGSLILEEQRGGRFRLTLQPSSATTSAVEGEPLRYAGRTHRAEQDWRRFPVAALSWIDARAYLDWLARTGRLPGARFCTEHEWERAARGADDRLYPHGYRLDPDDANIDVTYGRRPDAYGPDEIGVHPASDSPFGVADLTGNVWEWTSSIQQPGAPSVRGGSYYQEEFTNRSTNRDVGEADARDPLVGLRVCASLPR